MGSVRAREGAPRAVANAPKPERVSPRARGSAVRVRPPNPSLVGQSARARERLVAVDASGVLAGSVRAREGAPRARSSSVSAYSVSPRARGSAVANPECTRTDVGQSARARERRGLARHRLRWMRSVRAREGAPGASLATLGASKVSPRARGSAALPVARGRDRLGQSARARERLNKNGEIASDDRSVRAREGAPISGSGANQTLKVSPRARGSAVCRHIRCGAGFGQSARARERRYGADEAIRAGGSVRAREGAPDTDYVVSVEQLVSPRARGSAAAYGRSHLYQIGQSARARERRHASSAACVADGSVRAREGAPGSASFEAAREEVSPRARGSAAAALGRMIMSAGSVRAREGAPRRYNGGVEFPPVSPRARGSAAAPVTCISSRAGQSARARERLARSRSARC